MNSDYPLSATLVLPIKCGARVLFVQRNASFVVMPFVGLELEGAGLPLGDGRQAVPVVHEVAYDLDDDSLTCTLNDSAVPNCETVDDAIKKFTGRNSRWTIGEVIDSADYCHQDPKVAVHRSAPSMANADKIATLAGPIAANLLARFLPKGEDGDRLFSEMYGLTKPAHEICVRDLGRLDISAAAAVALARKIVDLSQNGAPVSETVANDPADE